MKNASIACAQSPCKKKKHCLDICASCASRHALPKLNHYRQRLTKPLPVAAPAQAELQLALPVAVYQLLN
jgi:hypothetical protein